MDRTSVVMTASRKLAVSVSRRSCVLLALDVTIEILCIDDLLLPGGSGEGMFAWLSIGVSIGLAMLLEVIVHGIGSRVPVKSRSHPVQTDEEKT